MKQEITTPPQDANAKLKLMETFGETSFDRHYFAKICDNPLTGAFKKKSVVHAGLGGTPVATEKSGLFGTLGAYPDSDHARECLKNARAFVKGNEILGEFLCQGKVDPALIKIMETKMMDAPHHSMTPERRARLEEAAKHPDEKDLADARALFFKLAQIAAGKVSA
ncbi:flavodoxin family protein [Desulfobacter sp.]|jgi:hypothetical protein|uniref:flavodoxin family protein n=1 Tax=Desulfobacter sp. TaxID=2294 RepID=UPI000E94DD67|nr:flavodoxin family protein [Desulfobacter sp.]HBT89979.1 hypothetical protein [Desulfobacter sp.]